LVTGLAQREQSGTTGVAGGLHAVDLHERQLSGDDPPVPIRVKAAILDGML
jgi:hypothetical protein